MIWLLALPTMWAYAMALTFAPIPTIKVTVVFWALLYGLWFLAGLAP